MPTFTTEQVVTTLHEILLDHGREHIYELSVGISCFYRQPKSYNGEPVGAVMPTLYSDGAPGCIIGHLLDRLSVLPEVLGYDVNYSAEHDVLRCEGLNAAQVFALLDVEFEDEAVASSLEVLQGDQDMGQTWGAAVERFCIDRYLSVDAMFEDVTPLGRLVGA